MPALIISKLQCSTLSKLLSMILEPLCGIGGEQDSDSEEEGDEKGMYPEEVTEIDAESLATSNVAFGRRDTDWDDSPIVEALDVYFLWLNLRDWDSKGGDFDTEHNKMEKNSPVLVKTLKDEYRTVEVYADGRCSRIHFKIPSSCSTVMDNPLFKGLSEEKIKSVPRTNPEEKAGQLVANLKSSTVYVTHMNHLLKIWYLVWAVQYGTSIINLPFNISLMIIALVIFTYGGDKEGKHPYEEFPWALYLVEWLLLVHIVATLLSLFAFFVVEAPMYYVNETAKKEDKEEDKKKAEKEKTDLRPPYMKEPRPLPEHHEEESLYLQMLYNGVFRVRPYYFLLMVLLSALSIVESPFYHSFLLVEYFRTPAGLQVMEALQVGGFKMFMTFLMGIVVIMNVAMVSWINYHEQIAEINNCDTLYECVLDIGHKSIQGILQDAHGDDHGLIRGEDYVPPESFTEDFGWHMQLVMLIFFLIIWDFILSGIMQGQIIDAFAEIRNAQEAAEADEKENCLMCSLSRFKLQSCGFSFIEHCADDHNPRCYLYFFQHILEKDPDDYTGLESYVREQYDQEPPGIDFVPINSCVALNDEGTEVISSKDVLQSIEKLDGGVIGLTQALGQHLEEGMQALQEELKQLHTLMQRKKSRDAEATASSQANLGALRGE